MTRAPATALLLALALSACGGGQADPAPALAATTPDGCETAIRRPLLVVVIPGGEGDPRDRLGLKRAARAAGIDTLYTTGGSGFWTLNDRQGRGDLSAVGAQIDAAITAGCNDPKRVAITGVSNGAGFAVRIACDQPERFVAVAPVSPGLRALDPCPPSARASFLEIHGSADTVTPYNGKRPGREGSVPRFAAAWARRAGCDPGPRERHPAARVTRRIWTGCAGGRHVETVLLAGTDHGWPGAGPPLPDHNPSGFKATAAVIAFVRRAFG